MTYNQETLDALIAAIDDRNDAAVVFLTRALPEAVQGQIMLAARAAKRVREATGDAIAAACEGEPAEAIVLVSDAEQDLATMRRRLDDAMRLADGG